jgi:hypothetical protein
VPIVVPRRVAWSGEDEHKPERQRNGEDAEHRGPRPHSRKPNRRPLSPHEDRVAPEAVAGGVSPARRHRYPLVLLCRTAPGPRAPWSPTRPERAGCAEALPPAGPADTPCSALGTLGSESLRPRGSSTGLSHPRLGSYAVSRRCRRAVSPGASAGRSGTRALTGASESHSPESRRLTRHRHWPATPAESRDDSTFMDPSPQ